MGKILLLFCVVASFSNASDFTVLVLPANQVYQLQEQATGGVGWAPAPANLLRTPAFNPRPGFASTVHGTTQIFKNERQISLVRFDGTPTPEPPFPLPTPTAGRAYQRVLRDKAGNVYAEHSGGGFAFCSFENHFTVTAEEFEYSTETNANMRIVPNPKGAGVFYLDAEGSELIYAAPPAEWGHEFKLNRIKATSFAQGRLKRVMLVAAGDKVYLGAITTGGTFGLILFDEASLNHGQLQFKPIPWPADLAPGANPDLRTTFEALPALASTTALTVASANDPVIRTLGSDRIIYREGKLHRIGRHGEVIPAPPGAMKKIQLKEKDDPGTRFIAATRSVPSDDVTLREHFGESPKFHGRVEEMDRILDIMARTTGNHPLVTGDVGVGRSTIGPLLAQYLTQLHFVDGTRYASLFQSAIVVETTPDLVFKFGGMNKYLDGQASISLRLGRPVITVIQRFDQMATSEYRAMEEHLQNHPDLLVLGVASPKEAATLLRREPEFAKHFEIVRLLGMSDADTKKILLEISAPQLAESFRTPAGPAQILPEAIDTAIRRAKQIFPDLGFPEGPRRLLEDMVISTHRKANGDLAVVDERAARAYIKKALSLPFDPDNKPEFEAAIADIRTRLKKQIVEQDRVVDWLVDSYRDILQPNAKKRHRTVLLLGPTGGGKTYTLQTAFKAFFRDEKRILEVDCTKYLEKEALTTLLGSWPGYVGSDKLGVLPKFLSDNGKNFNGIIFNEWEKASKELANAVMEMMDNGVLTDSHGNQFHVGTSLIGLTSNKGDKVFFPRNAKLTREEQEKRAHAATSDDVKQRFLEPEPDQLYETKNNHTPANMQRIDAGFYVLPPSTEGAKTMLRDMTASEVEGELGVRFVIDDGLLNAIVAHKYVPENGVREPQRALKDALRAAFHKVSADLPESGDRVVEVKLAADGANSVMTVAAAGKAPTTVPVNFIPKSNIPLEDPATREKIRTLRQRMAGKVFGQEQAIETLADSIINQRYVDPDPERPGVAGFFGPTGTGKSELAEVVAEVEFGSRDRARSFQMGSIKTMDDVDNLFGTARGRAGSDSPAEFQQFLQQYPEGGVLHFEEMGNVGADNPRVRDAVFRILYSILEGKWTDPMGKTHRTGKFFVVFSSNEGQELFADAPADDLRMAIYKRNRSQEAMRELLREHKWPEPLIGRSQGHLILFKPLVANDRMKIAGKFFDGVLGRLRKRYPINVTTDEAFLIATGETFFSHEQGARAIRDFFEEEVRTLFGTSFAEVYEKHGKGATEFLKTSHFKLALQDNYAGLNYFVGRRPDERKVTLTLKLIDAAGATLLEQMADVTEMSPERHLPAKHDLLKTAYHEAGHVVANDPDLTGLETDHVTIVGKGNYGGYARPIRVPGHRGVTRSSSIAYIGHLFGGRIAEAFAGYENDAGWSKDLDVAREAATRAVAKYGLTDAALSLPVKDKTVDLESIVTQVEIEQLMRDGFRYARERIKSRWPEIRLLTYRLFKKQALDRSEIKAILEEARSIDFREGVKLNHQKEPRPTCSAILDAMETNVK